MFIFPLFFLLDLSDLASLACEVEVFVEANLVFLLDSSNEVEIPFDEGFRVFGFVLCG